MPQSRNFVFTRQLNEVEVAAANTAAALPDPFTWHHDERIRYLRYQIERAPTTGKLHVQGFISFTSPRKFGVVKEIIGNNPHVEFAKKVKEAIDYCGKPETRVHGPWEHGKRPTGQGERTDLKKVWEDVKNRKRVGEMLEENPECARYERQIKMMKFAVQENDSDRQQQGVKVYVFWGPTDLGKTYTALNLMDSPQNVFKIDPPATKGGNLWFDGYDGQRVLVMDEFEGENVCTLNKLKVLLDVYKCRLDIKGGHAWANWTVVIICSNSPPRSWYEVAPTAQRILDPLKRRIWQIRHFVARGIYVVQDWDENDLTDQQPVEVPPTLPLPPIDQVPTPLPPDAPTPDTPAPLCYDPDSPCFIDTPSGLTPVDSDEEDWPDLFTP